MKWLLVVSIVLGCSAIRCAGSDEDPNYYRAIGEINSEFAADLDELGDDEVSVDLPRELLRIMVPRRDAIEVLSPPAGQEDHHATYVAKLTALIELTECLADDERQRCPDTKAFIEFQELSGDAYQACVSLQEDALAAGTTDDLNCDELLGDDQSPDFGSESALRDNRWREFIAETLQTPTASRQIEATGLCENMRLIADGKKPTAPDELGLVLTSEGDWPSSEVAREFLEALCP
jgi:hypothetical protein